MCIYKICNIKDLKNLQKMMNVLNIRFFSKISGKNENLNNFIFYVNKVSLSTIRLHLTDYVGISPPSIIAPDCLKKLAKQTIK